MKLTFNTIKGHLYKHEWLHSGTVRTVAALSSPGGTHWLCVQAARETPGLTAVNLCCQSHRVCVPGLCLWKRICLLSWVLFLWRNCQDGIHPCLFWKDSHSLNSILASKDIVLTEKKKKEVTNTDKLSTFPPHVSNGAVGLVTIAQRLVYWWQILSVAFNRAGCDATRAAQKSGCSVLLTCSSAFFNS